MSVYDDDAFQERVNFAANYIANKRPASRRFDTCFEMHDGDAVAVALFRRAQKNPDGNLAANLFTRLSKHTVLAASERLAHVKTRDLKHAAATMRVEAKAAFDKWLAEHQAA